MNPDRVFDVVAIFALMGMVIGFAVFLFVMGSAAWIWGKATQAAHTARLHGAQADASIRALESTAEALDETEQRFGRPGRGRFSPDRPPVTPPDILEVIARQRELEREEYERQHGNGEVHTENEDNDVTTTLDNEGVDGDLPVHEVGGRGDMYRQ